MVLGFPIKTILAIFDLQVTPMLPTMFPSNGLSLQEKKRIDFQAGGLRTVLYRPKEEYDGAWISDQNNFSYF